MTRHAAPHVAVALATVAFAVATIVVGVIRYRIFRAQVDLGLFTQVVSSPLSGFSSTAEGGANHFAVHLSPMLLLCSPVLALARSPLALVVIQALASALCVPALYLLARRHVSTRMAALVAMVGCAYPPLVAMTIGDFHELAFATPTLLWLAWALETRRLRAATALAAVALLVKEDVTLVLAFVATALWWRARRIDDVARARFFASLATAAVLVLALYFGVVRPSLSPTHATSARYHVYDWSYAGPTPRGFADARSPVRPAYLAGVFAPLLGLPLATPAVALALPGLLEVLASHEAITIDLSTHYVACWLPYLFIAFVFGIARVARRSRAAAYGALACCLAISLSIDAFASPANFWYAVYRMPDARDARLERTLATLPRDASIGSDLWIFAHLGLHPRATIDPTHADFVVVDRRCDTAYCTQRIFPFVASSLARGTLRRAASDDGIELYRRSALGDVR